jgi:hypothetical protein
MSPTSKGIGIGATVLGLGGLAGTLAFVGAKKAAAERAERERLEDQARQQSLEERRKRLEAERLEAEAEQRRLEEQKRVEAEAEQRRLEEQRRVEAERVEKQKRIEAEAEQKRVDTEAEQKRLEAAAKKAAEEANMAAAAQKAAEAAASKAIEDSRKAQEAKNAEGTKKAAEDAKKAQKAEDEAALQKREEDRIETAQNIHAERDKSGDPIELTPIEIAHGIMAYYAERTDLQVPEQFANKLTPGPVYFVFERLCRATVAFWKRFVRYQREKTEILGHGAGAFEKTIDLYIRGCGDKYDMWVAYVTEAKPLTIAAREILLPGGDENENDETKIEMVVTVFVHRDTPVTSHMGIFRTDRYWHEDKNLGKPPYYMIPAGHKGISPLIHAFAACAALCLYRHLRETKSVMLTRPVHVMSKILRDALRPGEIRVGSPDERKKRHVEFRAQRDANHPDRGYSSDMYAPPLTESVSLPFFATSDSTWTFDGAAYVEPEWMSGECEHTDVTPNAHDKSSLEHTVLLSALARTWSAPSDQAERLEAERLEAERLERARIEAQRKEESEEGMIARHQKAHGEYTATGGIELKPISVAEGILAYYAERPPVSKSDGSTSGTAFFVFERLCKATVGFWATFVKNQLEVSGQRGHELEGGATAFKRTVDLYNKGCVRKYDMWVAYVSDSSPSLAATRENGAKNTKIEMAVTILVHRTTPVTSHIGIFRTYPYWQYDRKARTHKSAGRKGLSPLIHAFAAAAALSLYPHLREKRSVMLTRPVAVMGTILRATMQGEIRVGSPNERKQWRVALRESRHQESPDEGFSNDIYTPPLSSEAEPFFHEDERNSTWTFDGEQYPQPEWMSEPCEHTDVSPSTNDESALEHTVLLSALARKWSAPSDQASERGSRDASKCSIVVGHARIPVQCDDGKVTVDDHPCLDDWASKWNEIPRIAPFEFALGMLEGGRTCPVVEIHNNADGDCLLYALGFYLCVTRQGWKGDVKKLRHNIMDEVDRMLKEDGESDTFLAAVIAHDDYTKKQNESWAKYAATQPKKIDVNHAVSKYIFVNKMDRVDLGNLEIVAFWRLYGIQVCVWQEEEESDSSVLRRILMVPAHRDLSNVAVSHGGVIPSYGPCVHLRYYKKRTKGQTGDGGHYTLLALLDSEAPGFGRRRHRYV